MTRSWKVNTVPPLDLSDAIDSQGYHIHSLPAQWRRESGLMHARVGSSQLQMTMSSNCIRMEVLMRGQSNMSFFTHEKSCVFSRLGTECRIRCGTATRSLLPCLPVHAPWGCSCERHNIRVAFRAHSCLIELAPAMDKSTFCRQPSLDIPRMKNNRHQARPRVSAAACT